MYIYAYFYSVNPFECPKLIVGIVGIDGKSLLSNFWRLYRKFWRLRNYFSMHHGISNAFCILSASVSRKLRRQRAISG